MPLVDGYAGLAVRHAFVQRVGDGLGVRPVEALAGRGVVGPFSERDEYWLAGFGQRMRRVVESKLCFHGLLPFSE